MALAFSISEIARELGADRKTVSRRLAEAGVQPIGERQGYPVYSLQGVVDALGDRKSSGAEPDKMKPFERKAWFQSELARLELETAKGDLMKREDVVTVVGAIFGAMVKELETLSDRAERDLRIKPELVEYIRRAVREIRENMNRAANGLRPSL